MSSGWTWIPLLAVHSRTEGGGRERGEKGRNGWMEGERERGRDYACKHAVLTDAAELPLSLAGLPAER